jgi:hypothetical protein
MAKRRRMANGDMEDPLAGPVEGSNRIALRAFRLSQISLIPGVGLILGPLSAVLGSVARFRGRRDPAYKLDAPAKAAIVLGSLVTITNWLGLVLLLQGLRSLGW